MLSRVARDKKCQSLNRNLTFQPILSQIFTFTLLRLISALAFTLPTVVAVVVVVEAAFFAGDASVVTVAAVVVAEESSSSSSSSSSPSESLASADAEMGEIQGVFDLMHLVFSHVHATLQPAMSVGRSVGNTSLRVFCFTAPAQMLG